MTTIDAIAKAELQKSLLRISGNTAEYQQKLIQQAVNPKENLGLGYATVVLSRANFTNLSKDLIEKRYWSDSVNSVSFNKHNNYIKEVGLGIHNPIKAGLDKHKISIQNFSKMYADIAAMNIDKRPAEKEATENIYMDLIRYLDKNRTDK